MSPAGSTFALPACAARWRRSIALAAALWGVAVLGILAGSPSPAVSAPQEESPLPPAPLSLEGGEPLHFGSETTAENEEFEDFYFHNRSRLERVAQALPRLQAAASDAMQAYQDVRADLEKRLGRGAPPEDAASRRQWQQARDALAEVESHLAALAAALEEVAAVSAAFEALVSDPVQGRSGKDAEEALRKARMLATQGRDDLLQRRGLAAFERQKLAALAETIREGTQWPALPSPEPEEGENPSSSSADQETTASASPDPPSAETAPANAEDAPAPLMTIRFNRPNVIFSARLKDAVQRARAGHAAVRFRLIATAAPKKSDIDQDLALATAARYGEAVARAMQALGIAADQISVEAVIGGFTESNTVYLYTES